MLSAVGAQEQVPSKEWTCLQWKQHINSQLLRGTTKSDVLAIYEKAISTIDVDKHKNEVELVDLYLGYVQIQNEANVDPSKTRATLKLMTRYWPTNPSIYTTWANFELVKDQKRPATSNDKRDMKLLDPFRDKEGAQQPRLDSPLSSSKNESQAQTPLLKTPSPEQGVDKNSMSSRAGPRRFGMAGGAQRPPMRISDGSSRGSELEDESEDKSRDGDDSFEQPPTIRARPIKKVAVVNGVVEEKQKEKDVVPEELLPQDILKDYTLRQEVKTSRPPPKAKTLSPPPLVAANAEELEDEDMMVDTTTMMLTSRHVGPENWNRATSTAPVPPFYMQTPRAAVPPIPTPPKETDLLPSRQSLAENVRPLVPPPLPTFGSDVSMHRALESMEIQSPLAAAKPSFKLYNPAGAMTPKTGIEVNHTTYRKIELIGRGGSSKVYKIMNDAGKLYALKKVNVRGLEADAVEDYMNEIALLQRLKNNSRIIHLYDSEVNLERGVILMVLEYGEIDLAHLLMKDQGKLSRNFIRLYWEEMLEAVNSLHAENIIHSDLKPANFLMVQGGLKLIDFGIAKHIPNDTTNIHRDHQTGTLNYMSPEAITYVDSGPGVKKPSLKLGRSSDVWSLGCILYQFVFGRTPFSHLPMMTKLQSIVDVNQPIYYPPLDDEALLDAIKGCLKRNPKERLTIDELLKHPFLHPRGDTVEMTPQLIRDILDAVNQVRPLQPLSLGKAAQILYKQARIGVKLDLTRP
ncbi:hypothetical protein SmJEL517_g03637 [Synchytrium microbalum]|uniref:Protein kinase domain-containing protein n=1 Tax=Synchytrium microbalum TaxID=1806994 RepID=A0A507C681_9FUNG|nr:uncharacterized protein SmJEL517_g03637 [Synchytrium microbalum]TPX33476.1 hypothetical protein SmJEL517_g03637 [Synchytrium microbalum]